MTLLSCQQAIKDTIEGPQVYIKEQVEQFGRKYDLELDPLALEQRHMHVKGKAICLSSRWTIMIGLLAANMLINRMKPRIQMKIWMDTGSLMESLLP